MTGLDTKRFTQFIGFDLGDGESAVAWLHADKATAPQLIEVAGRKSFQSALGIHPELGVLIGQEAYQMTAQSELMVRFKQGFLRSPNKASREIRLFAQAVAERLDRLGYLGDPAHTATRVGCPSGWDEEARARYRELLAEAGWPHVEVVSESRAAFLYLRESGELPVRQEELSEPTLIIDAGSSTMDFTYIEELTEHALHDFGENGLGAGLIDQALWQLNLSRSPVREELLALFARFPQYAARCELEARRVKEMYFTCQAQGVNLPSESSVRIYYDAEPLTVDITATRQDMEQVLHQPMEALGGLSFLDAFGHALSRAREQLLPKEPASILLTGGASRMPLIAEGCRDTFPKARLLLGSEPEFAIARGLCYALRIDQRTQGFQREVAALMASGEIEGLLSDSLPQLFQALSEPLAEWVVEEIAMPVMLAWQRGDIATLNDVAGRITEEMARHIEQGAQAALESPAVLDWLSELEQSMRSLTDPICDRYDIRRSALALPTRVRLDPLELPFSPGAVVGVQSMLTLSQGLVGVLTAMLLGGGGTALLATGPLGALGGFFLGVLVSALGRRGVRRMLENARFPKAVRMLLPPFAIKRLLRGKKPSIQEHLYQQLMEGLVPPSPQVERLTEEVSLSIRGTLEGLAQKAFLLIR